KISAVDVKEVAKRVLTTHFIRDISGNLKAFAGQKFRCMKCNTKFRRIPMVGKCPRCGGKISLTVHRGGIEKYLEAAGNLAKKYKIEEYYIDRISLIGDEIEMLFKSSIEKKKQPSLTEFI
ncbi:MAG TPA: DNA polymerase II large subunit, partial [archaeon]|nr:DNA polymerase II large subunit [archaeon]